MQTLQVVVLCGCVLYGLIYLVLLIRTEKPLRSFFLHALLGLWFFAMVNLTAFSTGIRVPVNYGTVAVTAVGGVPGFLLLAVLRYFIF